MLAVQGRGTADMTSTTCAVILGYCPVLTQARSGSLFLAAENQDRSHHLFYPEISEGWMVLLEDEMILSS
jgi:hypothetical protein